VPAPIVPDLLDLFPDVVVIEHRLTTAGFGVETYASGVDVVSAPARIVGQVTEVRGPDGQLVRSTQHAVLAGVFDITVLDRFTLPSRFPIVRPRAVAIRLSTDENGPHHETVYF